MIAIDAEILERVIVPNQATLSEAAAREFLAFGFDERDRARMSELSAKARSGEMNHADEVEASGYERVGSLLGLLQSKARQSLRGAPGRV